jgi:hypothetical protein
MKHVKLFEEFEVGVVLIVKFKNTEEYYKAVEYFTNESTFFAKDFDSEFLSISFYCDDQEDADTTEIAIQEELDNKGITNYYFESE